MWDDAFAAFHLLRPTWLLALLPLALVLVLLWRRQSAAARWRKVIAPHLLEHLVVRPSGGAKLKPAHLLAVGVVLAILGAAGPTWRREPSPFVEDTAPLVIAMDLSPSMQVRDVQPSRLERAKQKVADLLATRKGAKTALIAYAGSAHRVMPLTDDPAALATFVESLEPSIMPVAGKRPDTAIELAGKMLADEITPGTVLFLSDGIPPESIAAFETFAEENSDQIQVLAVATEAGGAIPAEGGGATGHSALDRAALAELEQRSGARTTTFTVDDTDVKRVERRIDSHLSDVRQEDAEGRWRDEGWWLVLPVMLLALAWSRRGWTIRWE